MKKLLLSLFVISLLLISCKDDIKIYNKDSDFVDTKNNLYSIKTKEVVNTKSSAGFLLIAGYYDEEHKYQKYVEFYLIGKNNQIYYVKTELEKIRIVLTNEETSYCEIYSHITLFSTGNSNTIPRDWRDWVYYYIIYINEKYIVNKSMEINL